MNAAESGPKGASCVYAQRSEQTEDPNAGLLIPTPPDSCCYLAPLVWLTSYLTQGHPSCCTGKVFLLSTPESLHLPHKGDTKAVTLDTYTVPCKGPKGINRAKADWLRPFAPSQIPFSRSWKLLLCPGSFSAQILSIWERRFWPQSSKIWACIPVRTCDNSDLGLFAMMKVMFFTPPASGCRGDKRQRSVACSCSGNPCGTCRPQVKEIQRDVKISLLAPVWVETRTLSGKRPLRKLPSWTCSLDLSSQMVALPGVIEMHQNGGL